MKKLITAALAGIALIMAAGSPALGQSTNNGAEIGEWVKPRGIYWQALDALPPVFVIRPSHDRGHPRNRNGGMVTTGAKMLGEGIPFTALIGMAYGVDPALVVPAAGQPAGLFDIEVTALEVTKERVQMEIGRRFGFKGHFESRRVDVYLISLDHTNAPGLKPSAPRNMPGDGSTSGGGVDGSLKITTDGQAIKGLFWELQDYFDKPLIDHTGLAGDSDFDVTFVVPPSSGGGERNAAITRARARDAVMQALPAQLGLKITHTNGPMDVLVVEKVKRNNID